MRHLILLQLMLSLLACDRDLKELRFLRKIDKADLLVLGAESDGALDEGKPVVNGYLVVDSIPLTAKDKRKLFREFKRSKNYIKEAMRCRPEPQYAIVADGKTWLMFELEGCPKLVSYATETPLWLDLAADNRIGKVIDEIVQGKKAQ